jgi:predicted transcriptional regulator
MRRSAAIIPLQTRPERLRADQAEQLRQALLPFEGVMPDAVATIRRHIDRATASRSRWTFVMLSPSQNRAVVHYLRTNSSRPMAAMDVWALCFEHLDADTGEILLSRDQIAESTGDRPSNVSTIMGELEKFGAISRRRKNGGGVRYYMNPRVATHLAGKERDDAQAAAPQLRLVQPS